MCKLTLLIYTNVLIKKYLNSNILIQKHVLNYVKLLKGIMIKE